VLRDVSVSVACGQRVALVGANGAGKSTLLKSMAGILPTPPECVRWFGQPPLRCRHRVAYLPQRGEIDWNFPINLERLVLTGRYVHLGWFQQPSAHDHARARTELARLGLAQLAQRPIGQLSGGQQQRALLARALAQDAELLLLDEPMTAVDAETRDLLTRTLAELRCDGKTIVAATHDHERLQHDFDRVIPVVAGRVETPT
jgi:manganese/zinc/iron transport system ATP- binding protein